MIRIVRLIGLWIVWFGGYRLKNGGMNLEISSMIISYGGKL